MKKIGKESNGSELFTVIEPGMSANQLSEMEKDLILGGECDPVECSGNACVEAYCPYDYCVIEVDCQVYTCWALYPCMFNDPYNGSESDSESDSESYSDEFRYSIMA